MAQANAAPIVDDGCDSFDDDMGWILERLTERAGGNFGLIFRFIDGFDTPLLLARTGDAAALPAVAIRQLAEELRPHRASPFQLEVPELVASGPIALLGTPGSIRLLHMAFQPSPGVDIIAAVCRPASSFALLEGLVARRLYPVLARYIRLWWMHRTERRRASAFETAIDLAELGIILLDRRGQLLYENAYVRKILNDSDGMRRAGSSIAPCDLADSVRFQVAIQHALTRNGASDPDAALQAPLVLLRRGEPRRALILTVLPYPRRAVDPGDAAAIIYVLHPEHDMRRCLTPVYRIYGLTAAESRLVTELVKGSTLVEAAGSMNVSLPTVRAQLKQVFDKTRTNRQAELVKVMLTSAVRSSVSVDLSLV